MTNEDELHRAVTEFMLDTCHYSPVAGRDVQAGLMCGVRKDHKDFVGDMKVFSSGSCAEFYINPLLSCIGDIDVMIFNDRQIVIPVRQMPPTELLDYYHHVVAVYEITESHKPSYVYLHWSYLLEKNDNGHYDVVYKLDTTNVQTYFGHVYPTFENQCSNMLGMMVELFLNQGIGNKGFRHFLRTMANVEMHGPAIAHNPKLYLKKQGQPRILKTDAVLGIQCPVWPPQAADWPTRSRSHNWPDSETINSVVSNGCDVVPAVHPNCRQNEWMSKHQWRLSFSRAEVTLLNSWTPVQQIIYHMLRSVIKREVLTEEYDKIANLPKLNNYHIKTLMMWECELKHQSWWSAESSLIKLCSSLLHKLSGCVAVKCCQQYFINNCNLLDHFTNDDDDASLMLCNRLKGLADVPVLLSWFIKNYVLCSVKELVPFDNIWSNNIIQLRIVTEYQVKKIQRVLYTYRLATEATLLSYLHMGQRLNNKLAQTYMKELQRLGECLRDYFVAVTSLHIAYNTSIHSLTADLIEVLWTLFNPCTTCIGDNDTNASVSGGFWCIRKAIKLASLNNVGTSALQMLYNEMSKAYLHHSFAYGQKCTYSVVHVLLATLYYKSGHNQAATDHCKQMLKETQCQQYGVWSIGAEYLPPIDESVDAVLGLMLLYRYALKYVLNSGAELQTKNKDLSAFTTELLARYLYSKCSNVAHSDGNEVTLYRQHLLHINPLLLSDVLLFKTMETQLNKCARTPDVEVRTHNAGNSNSSSMDTSLLVTTLELVALEKLRTVRHMMLRELQSEQFHIMNEFEALYAYKCGSFEKCLAMCQSYLNMSFHPDFLIIQLFQVWAPEMLSLLDGELVSLFGTIRLIDPGLFFIVSHKQHNLIFVRTLLLYLMVQCQKKLSIDMHDTLQLICFVHYTTDDCFDRLVLDVIYRSLKMCINN